MAQQGLTGFFENFIKNESIFLDKKVLQSSYTPDMLLHRDEQIKQIAEVLSPVLKNEKPSNLFVYGKSGTGKTVSLKYIADELMNVVKKNKLNVNITYLNCKLKRVADTEYRLIAELARNFGKTIPATGLPTDEVYKIFFNAIDHEDKTIVFILDEIDQLVKKAGDEVLYNLTRINEELKTSQIALVGISNDMMFVDRIDPRVKSSLSQEELFFPPYNALQIKDILLERAKKAFAPSTLEEGVIEKCAAYAAREHGDARRALELLKVAGEVAERNGFKAVKTTHIDDAEERIEKDRIIDILTTQPKQSQLTLYAIATIYSKKSKMIMTGEIYELYKRLCSQVGLRPLTQRRVSDILGELDMLGIINARIVSKGRYGRTREITIATPESSTPRIKRILAEALDL